MQKKISTKAYIIQVQWQNKSFAGNIYDIIPRTRPTRGNRIVKFANIPNISYI